MTCRSLVLIALSFFVLTLFYAWAGAGSWITLVAEEDCLVENLQVVFCLLASFFFFRKYHLHQEGCDLYFLKTRKNIFFLLLAVGIFFLAGEEISWGQRIFNIQTPEALSQINIQKELNIHNLKFFHSNAVLSFDSVLPKLCMLFFLVAPILKRIHAGSALFIKRIHFPIVPIPLGFLFYVISKKFSLLDSIYFLYTRPPFWELWELKELDQYFLIMIIAVWFLFGKKASAKH